MGFEELYKKAKGALNPKQISKNSYAGSVTAAILFENVRYIKGCVLIRLALWDFVQNTQQ